MLRQPMIAKGPIVRIPDSQLLRGRYTQGNRVHQEQP